MNFSHVETFRVRQYECDLYEHVNNAIYLRYIEETALQAAEAAGISGHFLPSHGKRWWVKQVDIEYLQPLHYGDTVEVRLRPLWLKDTIFHQVYQLVRAGSEEVIARAVTVSELQNQVNGQPEVIPVEVMAALFPSGLPLETQSFIPYPPPPDPPSEVFRFQQKVALPNVDAYSQVDLANLASLVEESARQVVAAHYWPMERMLAEGFAVLLRRNQIDYWQPIHLDDELETCTWASDIKRASAIRHYQVYRQPDHTLLASIHSLGVWVNLSSGLPMRIPSDFLEDFRPNILMP